MSTLIKRIFCNHKYKQINPITLICEKCGKMKKIICCHDWETYKRYWVNGDYGEKYINHIMICKNCGKIIKFKGI